MAQVVILAGLLAIAMTKPAYAYIDHGTASIVLQAVIGAVAVTGFFFRSTVAKAFRLLRPGKHGGDSAAPQLPVEPVEHNTDDD